MNAAVIKNRGHLAIAETCQTTCQTNDDAPDVTTANQRAANSSLTRTNTHAGAPGDMHEHPVGRAHDPKVAGSNPAPATEKPRSGI